MKTFNKTLLHKSQKHSIKYFKTAFSLQFKDIKFKICVEQNKNSLNPFVIIKHIRNMKITIA